MIGRYRERAFSHRALDHHQEKWVSIVGNCSYRVRKLILLSASPFTLRHSKPIHACNYHILCCAIHGGGSSPVSSREQFVDGSPGARSAIHENELQEISYK